MWHIWGVSMGKPEGKFPLRRPGNGWEDNIEIGLM
jgi:hypothetical protein